MPVVLFNSETQNTFMTVLTAFGIIFFIVYSLYLEYMIRHYKNLAYNFLKNKEKEFKEYKKEIDFLIKDFKIVSTGIKDFLGIEENENK